MKPRIGIIPGDPSGIGPELIARLLNEEGVQDKAEILLIGDEHVFEAGQRVAGATFDMTEVDANEDDWSAVDGIAWHSMTTIDPADVKMSEVTREGGHSVLRTLDQALEFGQKKIIDAIVFAPFNKASMHLAGLQHDDELHYMAEKLDVENYVCEINTLDGIWTSRVTSHIALREVADTITEDRICEAVGLIGGILRRSGLKRPRISVAALNPHAGDGGNFGTEEIDIIAPAVRRMAEKQIAVDGPWPSDTVFLKAVAGEIDAVVTMYHDQGQIAIKLLGFDRGVSVQGGLPLPVSTPAHGTAFDIAGKGKADVGATHAAFDLACEMAINWEDGSIAA